MIKSLSQKYKVPVIVILIIIASIVNFILVDLYVLPRQKINDNITSVYEIYKTHSSKFGRSRTLFGYQFYTDKGLEFTTEKKFIDETTIEIEQTKILKNIARVKTVENDYSNWLVSGWNGPSLYFIIILAISTTISVVFLLKKKSVNDNEFYNVVLFNSFMLFFIGLAFYCIN